MEENSSVSLMFQSTPPRGGRHGKGSTAYQGCGVSIHAPTWGATFCNVDEVFATMFQSTPPRGGRPASRPRAQRVDVFQSTPPRGGRLDYHKVMFLVILFQSTPPRGGRHFTVYLFKRYTSFNPRPHVGGDLNNFVLCPSVCVSIHAPTWGATLWYSCKHAILEVSIHAPTWGATGRSNQIMNTNTVSIHAPTWGAT